MNVMNMPSQTVIRKGMSLHEDVSMESFSRLGDSKKASMGKGIYLRLEGRQSVLWAQMIPQKLFRQRRCKGALKGQMGHSAKD